MTGPTIHTTAAIPPRGCWVCGDPAVAGTGVAVARWWCLVHLQVGLANTTADLAITRAELHEVDDEPYTAQDASDVSAALQEESLPWRSESRGDDDQEAATA